MIEAACPGVSADAQPERASSTSSAEAMDVLCPSQQAPTPEAVDAAAPQPLPLPPAPVPLADEDETGPLTITIDAKERLRWSPRLHACFCKAVAELGGSAFAKPKDIVIKMCVPGLTLAHVKSHLQKYRQQEGTSFATHPVRRAGTGRRLQLSPGSREAGMPPAKRARPSFAGMQLPMAPTSSGSGSDAWVAPARAGSEPALDQCLSTLSIPALPLLQPAPAPLLPPIAEAPLQLPVLEPIAVTAVAPAPAAPSSTAEAGEEDIDRLLALADLASAQHDELHAARQAAEAQRSQLESAQAAAATAAAQHPALRLRAASLLQEQQALQAQLAAHLQHQATLAQRVSALRNAALQLTAAPTTPAPASPVAALPPRQPQQAGMTTALAMQLLARLAPSTAGADASSLLSALAGAQQQQQQQQAQAQAAAASPMAQLMALLASRA